MTNRFYDHTTAPSPHSSGSSYVMRSEFDAIEAGFDDVQTEIDSAVANAVGAVGFKNFFINGRMRVHQRAQSRAGIVQATAVVVPTADMWNYERASSTLAVTHSVDADHPTLGSSGKCLKIEVTTADAAVAAGDYVFTSQYIQKESCYDLVGKACMLQFWVKSSVTGVHCVSFRRDHMPTHSQVIEYTIAQANTWEKKEIPITFNTALPTSGAGPGLSVCFTLMSGTTYHTTPNAWNAGNFLATANQVNDVGTIGNVIKLADLQLELGNTATDIEARPFGIELGLCKQFYEKGYDLYVYPGTPYTLGAGQHRSMEINTSSAYGQIKINFTTRKVAVPNITSYDWSGQVNKIDVFIHGGGWAGFVSYGGVTSSTTSFSLYMISPPANAAIIECQWTAEVAWP